MIVLIAWPGLVLCWCAGPLMVGRVVLVRAPPPGGVCCIGVCPPPWSGVLRWFVAPLMVKRVVLVRGPPRGGACAHGGACCVGACWPRWWCVMWWCLAWVVVVCWVAVAGVLFAWPALVLCWCVPPPLLGRAVFVRGPPLGGACCVGAPPPHGGACCVGWWPPSWWGVLCWCVAPLLVGRAVLVPARRDGGAWFGGVCLGLSPSVGWVAVAVVSFAWPGLVLCWCPPPPPCWGVPCLCVAPP